MIQERSSALMFKPQRWHHKWPTCKSFRSNSNLRTLTNLSLKMTQDVHSSSYLWWQATGVPGEGLWWIWNGIEEAAQKTSPQGWIRTAPRRWRSSSFAMVLPHDNITLQDRELRWHENKFSHPFFHQIVVQLEELGWCQLHKKSPSLSQFSRQLWKRRTNKKLHSCMCVSVGNDLCKPDLQLSQMFLNHFYAEINVFRENID